MRKLPDILKFDRRTHRPCFDLSVALALGIFLGRLGFLTWGWWSVLCGTFIALSLFRIRLFIVPLYLSVVCLGALYYQNVYILPENHVAFLSYQDQKKLTAIEGVIDSDIQLKATAYGTKQVFELKIESLALENLWQPNTGSILVNCFKTQKLDYGDRIKIEGSLFRPKSNPGERFVYQQYLEDHGLFFILSVGKKKSLEILSHHQGPWWGHLALVVKHRFKQVLEYYLEPQEVSMIQAMTLGDRSVLSKDMYALFSQTGTSHILAISGMNMAIIGAMMMFALKVLCVPRRGQFILTAVFLVLYCFICGWSASVVRSVLMACVVLSSFCLEYEGESLNTLGLAALIILLINPLSLYDIGFQLSFLCVLSIVSFLPLVNGMVERHFKPRFLKFIAQALSISLIAWIGITPLIAYQFEIVSLVSIVANIPVVPLADLVIILSLGLVGVGLVCSPLAWAFAGALKAVFNLILILISTFAQIPGAYFYVYHLSLWKVLGYYLLLFMALLFLKRSLK